MSSDFAAVFSDLQAGVIRLAADCFKDFSQEATKDGLGLLEKVKTKLPLWIEQAGRGDMSPEDLIFLLKGENDLMIMAALQKKGLAKIQIDKFTDGVCGLLTKTLFGIK